jgi:EAL and modified HD-GYP domain-containing signal transduction protein
MDQVLVDLPIAADVKEALLGTRGRLRTLLDFMVAFERGEWETAESRCAELALAWEDVPPIHWKAIAWSQDSLGAARHDEGSTRRAA